MRVLYILFLVLAGPSFAQTDMVRLHDSSEDCPVDLPDWATPSEVFAWDRICRGLEADMSSMKNPDDGAGCDKIYHEADGGVAVQRNDWPNGRQLSARFIKLIVTRTPYIDVTAKRRTWISCASVLGLLDLEHAHIPYTLWIEDSLLPEGANFRNTSINGELAFDGSIVKQRFEFWSAHIEGNLFLRNGVFPGIGVRGATVGGNLEASGSNFTEPFQASRLSVGEGLFLHRGAEFSGEIWLSGATIAGQIQLQGSTYNRAVDLTETTSAALMLWQPESSGIDEQVPSWDPNAKLVLRNATTGSLQFMMPNSWQRADGTAVDIDPVGFSYDRLGGLGSGDGYDLSAIDTDFVDAVLQGPFLDVQGTGFVPQPYMQLETVLRDMGADRAADRVALARHARRIDWLWGEGHYLRAGAERLWSALTGFGFRPFRVLWWFGGLVLIGVFVARHSKHFGNKPLMQSVWYSLENALPLVQPSERQSDVSYQRPWIDNFFHFQKLAGFVLATVLVGALTLLGG